jgi:hypothetical protein
MNEKNKTKWNKKEKPKEDLRNKLAKEGLEIEDFFGNIDDYRPSKNRFISWFIENIIWKIEFFYEDFINFVFYKPKYFIQRGIRGYSDYDLYDFDYYLRYIISDSLKNFKKSYYDTIIDENNFCDVIDEITEGFDIRNDNDGMFWSENDIKNTKKIEKFYDYPYGFNKEIDIEDSKKYNKAKKLLIKHLDNLWI